MARHAVWFVIRDEDVDKVMAAVDALHLPAPEEAEVGGFLLTSPKFPTGGIGGPTLPGRPRLPGGRGGGVAGTLDGTGCSTTNWGSDGNCSDCGADA